MNVQINSQHSLEASTHGMAASAASRQASPRALARDLRLDFFRGLALIFIFIDHVPGNSLANLTMRAFGISDAAEVFVLIAGFAAFTAYSGPIEREGFRIGARRIAGRVRDLYAAHLLLIAVCGTLLALAAQTFENPLYFEDVNLTPLSYDPWGAIWRLLVLHYQPGYLNILPLYIVLLAWLPVFIWLLSRGPWTAMAASVALWLVAGWLGVNLPSWPDVYGWYFNPLAWQLLFSIGAFAAFLSVRGGTLPRSRLLATAAALYIAVGFLVAAPWINIPALELPRLVAFDFLGYHSKTNLSLWRLAHVLAVAYLVALLVPASAVWLRSRVATWIVNCGRNGLDIFCLGTLLSFCGFVVMLEAGRTWEFQLAVNVLGIGGMFCTANVLTQRKAGRALAKKAAHATARQSSAVREQAPVEAGAELPP